MDKAIIRDFRQVKDALGKTQLLDARSAPRFEGSEAEPRPGLKSGHMPGATNLPWRAVLTADFKLKDDASLQKLFAEKGVDLRAPIITSCGSGISAAILILAVEKLGARQVSLYDGSWAEWGGRDDAPIATGLLMSSVPDPRRIPMTVTFLEMTAKPAAIPPPLPKGKIAFLKGRKSAGSFLSLSLRYGGREIFLGGPPEIVRRQAGRDHPRPHHPALCSVHGRNPGRDGRAGFSRRRHRQHRLFRTDAGDDWASDWAISFSTRPA